MSPEAVSSTLELNEEGFLAHPEGWTPDVATVLAREQEGIETLGDKHWAAINYIRAYYLEKGMAPMIRALCQNTGLRLREIYDLAAVARPVVSWGGPTGTTPITLYRVAPRAGTCP